MFTKEVMSGVGYVCDEPSIEASGLGAAEEGADAVFGPVEQAAVSSTANTRA